MTWEEKISALQALSEVSLRRRGPWNWYVWQAVERKEGSILSGGNASGATPQEAVERHWEWLTDPRYCAVVHAYSDERRAYRWQGFMWQEIDESLAA